MNGSIQSEAEAFANEKVARINWISQYRKNYGKLITLFPDEKALYEGFFPKLKTRKDKETDEEEAEQ